MSKVSVLTFFVLLKIVLSKKFLVLNNIPDREYDVVPEFFTFVASIRLEETPIMTGSLISSDYVMVLANLVDEHSPFGTKIEDLSCR